MKGLIYFDTRYTILDRHHAWRSLDPTLVISSPFMKAFYLLFLERHNFLQKCIISFALGYPPGYLPCYPLCYLPCYPPCYPPGYPPNYLPSYPHSYLPSYPPRYLPSYLPSYLLPCYPPPPPP